MDCQDHYILVASLMFCCAYEFIRFTRSSISLTVKFCRVSAANVVNGALKKKIVTDINKPSKLKCAVCYKTGASIF